MSLLKMAVVGTGALGRHHARILSEFDDVRLVAVADTNPDSGRAVADACGTQWVADARDLLGEIDAVSIVVPTTAHLSVAADFLSRGTATLVEKPLASSVAEAEQLVELSQRHSAVLQVGHIERFNPAMQVARNLCGKPKYIHAERLSPYAFRSTDIGVVLDLMIHDLDLILDLAAAPILSVEAFGVSILGEHEDTAQARIHFEGGCIADVTASRVNPSARRTMQVWSSLGCVDVDFATRKVVAYGPSERLLYGKSPLEKSREPGADVAQLKADIFGKYIEVHEPDVSNADALTAELRSFIECVCGQHRPLVGGLEGLAAMQAADQVLNSLADHQWNGSAHGAVGPFPAVDAQRKLAG